MTNVFVFPNKLGRDWAVIRPEIEAALVRLGASDAAKARVLEAARSFLPLLEFNIAFTVPNVVLGAGLSAQQAADTSTRIGEAVSKALDDQLHPLRLRLFAERLNREISHCQELGIF